MDRLHAALKTEQIATASGGGVDLLLVKLQHGKADVVFSLHANPRQYTTNGVQTTDLLAYFGFARRGCPFVHGECLSRQVTEGFDLSGFAEAFGKAYPTFQQADQHLASCGIYMAQPEGWGIFRGRPSGATRPRPGSTVSDGHRAARTERMKEASDEVFHYIFTWIEGGADKGWTTHYRPKHPPLSGEIKAALDFLGGFREFPECPECDFEPCYWRFTPREAGDRGFFDNNAGFAHQAFDNHATRFAPGLQLLLTVHAELQKFGLGFLAIRAEPELGSLPLRLPATPRVEVTIARGQQQEKRQGFRYDVALSFAGTERDTAERLATMLREAGVTVFYDRFYPEQLWGKDLATFFDAVYRKESRFCVVFVSGEYAAREWTNHERRSALARAIAERGNEYILPIEVEPVELAGLPPTIGRVSLSQYTIDEIAGLIRKKLEAS